MSQPRTPTAKPYAMPRPHELPDNVVPWTADPSRAAVLFHDMQEFFLRGLPDTPSPRGALVDNCVRLRDMCRKAGVPVGYTTQPGSMTPTERGLLRAFWGPGMSGTPGDRAVISKLAPEPDDRVFTKWRYSAFHASNLDEWLSANHRDQLVICGVYAHIGILATALDSFSRDIETFLVSDSVADFSGADHMLALDYAARNCASVQSACKIVEALGAHRRHEAPSP